MVLEVEKAAAYYRSVGIGSWLDYPPLAQYTELDVPNAQAFRGMRCKYADLANVQLQLCQPNGLDSPQRRFLDSRGEGYSISASKSQTVTPARRRAERSDWRF